VGSRCCSAVQGRGQNQNVLEFRGRFVFQCIDRRCGQSGLFALAAFTPLNNGIVADFQHSSLRLSGGFRVYRCRLAAGYVSALDLNQEKFLLLKPE
jgi:hypothetical protein